jgi:predicted dehydrogenase
MSGHRSRRGFLLDAASGVAAAMVIPACVFAESTAAKEKALRFGVIGTGHRGCVAHIPAIKSFADDMEIVGLCDVMENHLAQGFKRAGGSVQTYGDYQKLLANGDINAVMIATPNCVHKEVVLAALQAGKHVMCEKPMAVCIEECNAMKQAAEARPGQVVLYTMQLHYSLRFAELKKALEAGRIGKLKYIVLNESRGDWNRGDVWKYDDPKQGKVNWRFSHAASGGTLSEKVCHYFDILHWMVGSTPKHVMCDGGIAAYRDGRDTWDHATTTMVYEDAGRNAGATKAVHTLCMFGPHRLDFQIIGDEGSLTVGETSTVLERKGKKEELTLPEEIKHGERGPKKGQETAVLRMYEDFLACVKEKKKPLLDVEMAMASCKTAWLGELSSEKRREVRWDEI